ncbi:MAG TPA: hypothetical protein VNY05_46280 [Candidatus Acidoferrales bacterium]|nr:hypothetical protein [Candidatus Acidoferrales bacterium]
MVRSHNIKAITWHSHSCRSTGILACCSHSIPPCPRLLAPVLWGDAAVVRQRFGEQVSQVQVVPRLMRFDYPFEPQAVVQLFRDYSGRPGSRSRSWMPPGRRRTRQTWRAFGGNTMKPAFQTQAAMGVR